MANLMRKMWTSKQIKEIAGDGLKILTIDLENVSSGQPIPTTEDCETLIKIMKKEIDSAGVYLVVNKPYMKIEGFPTWQDNTNSKTCSLLHFDDIASGDGQITSDGLLFYHFFIDWENVARVSITQVSP